MKIYDKKLLNNDNLLDKLRKDIYMFIKEIVNIQLKGESL